MTSVILFGIGSPIILDYEESAARCHWTIVSGIRNVDAPVYASRDIPVIEAHPGLRIDHPVLLPMFTPANRRQAWQHAVSLGARAFPFLIDPTSILPRQFEIGDGTYINAGCVIGAAPRLGRFVLINRGSSIGHHADIGDFVSIGPGAVLAGQVRVGAGTMIGAGAVILPGVEIGAEAVVPAGAVVRRNVPAGMTAWEAR